MEYKVEYDVTDPLAIVGYAKKLEGRCLAEFIDARSINTSNKGQFGQLIETFLGIPVNSVPGADFKTIGGAAVEVKSLPLTRTSKGLRAKERMVFNIIDYMNICSETWETSHFLEKNHLILLVMYFHQKDTSPLFYKIHKVRLLQLDQIPPADYRIMKDDWEKIVSIIRDGRADELSEGSTFYLGACTKGSRGNSSFRPQPYSGKEAKQRAFSWKQSYINHILEELCDDNSSCHTVYGAYAGAQTFEQTVLEMFNPYIGKSAEEIAHALGKTYTPASKNYFALLSRCILGANDDQSIKEFKNADVNMKTICLESNGRLAESISFPYIRYNEIIYETWEESTLREQLDKKFFFVVFRKDEERKRYLEKVMFWNIPETILETDVRKVWEHTRDLIKDNRFDELPGMSWNPVCHVRPHARNAQDTILTATGLAVVKKCFWLKNTFILSQINK